MIIGTASQLGTLAIVAVAGILIAFIIRNVHSDRVMYILSGIISLLVAAICTFRVYTAMRDSDIQGAFVAVFFSILAFFVTIGAFANAKEC
jgi:cytochrome bd-type quinol oxidase subunit 2